MSEKRKDNRGRVLHNGEIQRKDGRYQFKYIDANGKEKFVYSWRLDHNDATPQGKVRTLSLREMERQIQADLFDNIVSNGGNMTVLELVEKYISTKTGVRPTTKAGYKTVTNFLSEDPFGRKRIDTVRLSDAKCWLIKLQADELASVIVNDSHTRLSITRDEERKFLKFVKEDPHFCKYYEGIYILFHTGLRISEFCGLTLGDIDFENHKINVDHQLQKRAHIGYYIESTKTTCGTRVLPMTEDVEACFRKIISERNAPKVEPIVDGYTGFLYYDKDGSITYSLHWDHYFKHIVEKYNSIYKLQMPEITPHVCRHTYCSNMAKSGMNPKTLQYLMGHADIGTTLNVYTHVNFEDAKAEIEKLNVV